MTFPPPPFNKLDRFHYKIKGFDLGYLFKPNGWRIYVLFGVIIGSLGWTFFGYEGTFDQVERVVKILPSILVGTKTLADISVVAHAHYGIGTHFSAAVIYGVMFYALSKYYETVNIKRSLNIFMTFAFTAFAISIFEYTWMASYYTAQHQFWVLAPLTRQASILYQNLIFLIAGIFAIVLVANPLFPYRFRKNRKFYCLVGLCLGLWAFWYFYPLPTKQLQVELETGEVWTSYPNFPQTMYTIDRNPHDNDAVGEPFFVEDNIVHTVNNVMKIVWAYTVFYFGKVKKVE